MPYPYGVVVYPLPQPLLVGESDLRACGPLASFSINLVRSAVTPEGSVYISRADNVVRMWVQLVMCIMWVCATKGT